MARGIVLTVFLVVTVTTNPALACEICAKAVIVDQATLPCLVAELEQAKTRRPSPRTLIDVGACVATEADTRSVIPGFPEEAQQPTSRFVIETHLIDCLLERLAGMPESHATEGPIPVSFDDATC